MLVLSLVPSPYDVFAPGAAVELSRSVTVDGCRPPARRFFLTDVSVTRASVLLLARALWPGVALVAVDDLVPAGVGASRYERAMTQAMIESQIVATYVAERAAGYAAARPKQTVVITGFASNSLAPGSLAVDDEIERVGSTAIAGVRDIARGLAGVAPGTPVDVAVVRGGRAERTRVVTTGSRGSPRLGVAVALLTQRADAAVPVRYAIDGISGSSAGLMFALDVYATLREPSATGPPVAGTGTIAPDGTVGPIEGVRQKLEGARRAGASVFLVPKQNVGAVRSETGIRIVPVSTFTEALAALGMRRTAPKTRSAAPARCERIVPSARDRARERGRDRVRRHSRS